MPSVRVTSLVLCLAAAAAPGVLAAQTRAAVPNASSCAPLPAARGATISFGNAGGNLRPDSTDVRSDGRVALAGGRAGPALAPAAVAGLARLARTGGFWQLNPAPITRPTRNPDAARRLIVVRLTCGTHRAVYPGTEAPAAFAELYALLTAVTGTGPH
jgi:hypothetical protein